MLTILLCIIYVSFISLGLPDALLGSAWPSMYTQLQVPISYAGIISMVVAGGTIVSSLMSYRLIHKLGTGKVTAISVGMTALALLGFSVSHSFLELCLWAIPYGLGAGSVDTALNNFVALHYKARHMNWLLFLGRGGVARPLYHGLLPDKKPRLEQRLSLYLFDSNGAYGCSVPIIAALEKVRFRTGQRTVSG